MKTAVFFFQFILLALVSCAQERPVVITNVDVFDGEQVWENVDFTFGNGKILTIEKNADVPQKATVIDGQGMTIIPPLVNAHVHVARPENLKEALSVGIFALLDMFTVDRRANYLRTFNDSINYAHYYSSNVGATVPNGHGTQYGVTIPTINNTVSPAQFVKDRIKLGADYIKIAQEHTMARLTEKQLNELISETHRQGKIAVAHVSELNDAIELARQNVDGFAHIWYRSPSVASEEDLNIIKAKGIFIVPTLSVIQKVVENTEEADKEELLPLAQVQQEVQKAHERGIPILAGTDARNYGMNYTTQLFDEFILLSQSGLSNIEVLKAGTTNIYQAFQLKEFERLTENAPASFVLIEGKPHLNLSDIYNKKRVWKNGLEVAAS